MSSPKGNSKHPQSVMYKDGKSKLVEQSEVEALMADGWSDNPAETKAADVDAKVPNAEPTPEPDAVEVTEDEHPDAPKKGEKKDK